jgi:hypothetical protein
MHEKINSYRIVIGKLGKIEYFGNLLVNVRRVLNYILNKYFMRVLTGFNCLRTGSSGVLL